MSSASAATAPPAAARAGQPADFDRLLNAFRVRVDREIASFLAAKRAATVALSGSPAGRPPLSDPADLVDGVAALLAQGGKRLRPALVYFTYRACGGQADEQALQLALSTELLHTYLLIHDDIMDHAETRRGLPAAHVRFSDLHRAAGLRGDAADFGRSAALLLGDLAHTYAAELFTSAVLLGAASREPLDGRSAAVPAELSRCFAEMCEEVIGGQYLEFLLAHRSPEPATTAAGPDLAAGSPAAAPPAPAASAPPVASDDHREAELLRILRLKSGRYTAERPIQLGALLAGAPAAARTELSRYGTAVGEAFQLQDDLLGVFGDAAITGKPVGDDLREGKYTLLVHHALLALDAASPTNPAAPSAPSNHRERSDAPGARGAAGEDRRFLLAALGNATLGTAEVARAQAILEATGARRTVTTLIAERLAAARGALDALIGRLDGLDDLDAAPAQTASATASTGSSHPGGTAAIAEGLVFLSGLLDYLRERDQ